MAPQPTALDLARVVQTVAHAIGTQPGVQSIHAHTGDGLNPFVTVTANSPEYVRGVADLLGWATGPRGQAGDQVSAWGTVRDPGAGRQVFEVFVTWVAPAEASVTR